MKKLSDKDKEDLKKLRKELKLKREQRDEYEWQYDHIETMIFHCDDEIAILKSEIKEIKNNEKG